MPIIPSVMVKISTNSNIKEKEQVLEQAKSGRAVGVVENRAGASRRPCGSQNRY